MQVSGVKNARARDSFCISAIMRPTALLTMVSVTAVVLLVLLSTLAPCLAWAAEGSVVGYAYLDPGGALVVQHERRSETLIDQIGCRDLGPWLNDEVPWTSSDIRDEIRSASLGLEGDRLRPTSCKELFAGCSNLASLDLSGLETANVADMSGMFNGCSSLEDLDLSGLDMSSLTDASAMFCYCSSLRHLDLTVFKSTRFEKMNSMFANCSSLKSLDLSGLDTSRVYDMSRMFRYCSSLETINLSGLDVSNVDRVHYMFYGCSSLLSLDISGFTRISYYHEQCTEMLRGCDSLVMLTVCSTLPVLALAQVVSYGNWYPDGQPDIRFNSYEELQSFLGSASGTIRFIASSASHEGFCGDCKWIISNGVLFIYPKTGQEGTLPIWGKWDYANSGYPPWNAYSKNITSAQVSGTVHAKTCFAMFSACSSLKTLDLSGLDTSQVTDMDSMFSGCSSLETIDLSILDTSQVTTMRSMFYGCSRLEALDLKRFETSRVGNMNSMFYGCSSLKSLDLSAFNTSRVSDMSNMFVCASLETLDVSSFDVSSIYPLEGTPEDIDFGYYCGIRQCSSLRQIRISSSLSILGGVSLPYGLWQSDDGEMYGSGAIPIRDIAYTRIAATREVPAYATLDASGCLTLSVANPEGAENAWLLSESGYESPDMVPWASVKGQITSVCVAEEANRVGYVYGSVEGWFDGCAKLTSVNLVNLNDVSQSGRSFARVAGLFRGCSSLVTVVMPSNLGFDSVDDFSDMFRGCSSLVSLDLSWLDTRHAVSMRRMFHGCRSLREVTLGMYFTFRGASTQRLPGSELPDGAWLPDEEHREVDGEGIATAYASDSVPSFTPATYSRLSDEELEDSEANVKVVSTRGEDDQGKPQLQVASTITEGDEGAEERLQYTVADDYAGKELYIGESPRAQALKFSKGKVKWNTVVSKVYASDRNYWTASAVIGRRVKAIAPYAFESAPNIQTLYVRSPKLKKYSKVHSSLANSNVSWVWVSGMSSSNVRKVVDAFNSWAWMG